MLTVWQVLAGGDVRVERRKQGDRHETMDNKQLVVDVAGLGYG